MHPVNKSSFPRMICKRTRIQHCSSLNLTVLTGSLEHISAFNSNFLSLSLSFYFHMPVFESFDWVLETHICSSFFFTLTFVFLHYLLLSLPFNLTYIHFNFLKPLFILIYFPFVILKKPSMPLTFQKTP